ncbi:QacE family quaternary ammonium compound efflux SMR transporter [Priestia megaterium]|uniref:QacE family quaternary ammonium compound efflux SMR transporter n=1 Tax=Priestia megaterium TaxID=1404 RepID=A0A3D8WZX7_PRIMG|nr:multidrug efflux SMR transporter [Priestia megaterium]MDH3168951.1 multidrug efflux SMR transporter [Priestia megaterium]RDZ12640.1 QacE family quaternary ammonium compound efflux SMR transporter [Priestia megaterium]
MAWALLILAGIEEVIATIAMKHMDGFKKKGPLFVMIIGFAFSFYCLSSAMRVLPAGVAYGVWTGVGSVGITLTGILWFKEKLRAYQLISLCFILIGVIGLKMAS